MTVYLRTGTRYDVTDEANIHVDHILPAGTYTVGYDEFRGVYFLDRINDFTNSGKVYGDTMSRVKRIMQTFSDRPNGTGVLLSGAKGSGKTLLAKLTSIAAMAQDIPTIVINQPHHGEKFNKFVQTIEQPAVIMFDEFEKVYTDDLQDSILTLLDGTYQSKKLFLTTCNDRYRINSYMLNRPGRFFYALHYQGIEEDFIREYCQDNLKDPSKLEQVVRASKLFDEFNFDMLKALVEELNRYGETVVEALRFLNISPESSRFLYKVTKFEYFGRTTDQLYKGFETKVSYGQRIDIANGFTIRYKMANTDEDGEGPTWENEIDYGFSDILLYDPSGKITAKNETAYVEIERDQERFFDPISML